MLWTGDGGEAIRSDLVMFEGGWMELQKVEVAHAADRVAGQLGQTVAADRELAITVADGGCNPAIFSILSPLWGLSDEEVFLEVYGGPVTFARIEDEIAGGVAETRLAGEGQICYDDDVFTASKEWFLGWGQQNVAHELTHGLAQRGGWGEQNWRAYEVLEATWVANPNFPRRNDREGNHGFAGVFPRWQQSTLLTANEEFADMGVGWTFNQWQDHPAGTARSDWMTANLPRIIALAVSGP